MNELDILGFDPKQLFEKPVETTKQSSNYDELIYHTRPADSKSADGHYHATIKLVLNPFNFKRSILEQQSYAIHDAQGWLTVISSLTNNDKSCPVFNAWKKCHYAKQRDGSFNSDFDRKLWLQQAKEEEGGRHLFDKRFARYVTVQIIEDKNHPELVGKYMFWKLPKAVFEIIDNQMNPSAESGKCAKPIMDFLFGRVIDLDVIPGPKDANNPERYTRETSYRAEISEDVVSVVNPDGSPILNDSERMVLDKYVSMMRPIWNSKDEEYRKEQLAVVNADPNTVELKNIYTKVLGEIKNVCPNIEEKLGYKEWSDNVKTRVNTWIEAVLAGNDPTAGLKTAPAAPSTTENDPFATLDNTPANEPAVAITAASEEEDLPF